MDRIASIMITTPSARKEHSLPNCILSHFHFYVLFLLLLFRDVVGVGIVTKQGLQGGIQRLFESNLFVIVVKLL